MFERFCNVAPYKTYDTPIKLECKCSSIWRIGLGLCFTNSLLRKPISKCLSLNCLKNASKHKNLIEGKIYDRYEELEYGYM